MKSNNPFEVTKSVDFSDEEINEYWVDLTGDSNFDRIIKPSSPMPMILLGGKGSGKTHIIRHLCYNTQRIRHKKDVLSGLIQEGYIGIYFSLGGLNEGRFFGKGIHENVWHEVLNYYLDLCVAHRTITTFIDVIEDIGQKKINEVDICSQILNLFDTEDIKSELNFLSILNLIEDLRKKVDYQVNNCVFTKKLDIEILITRGKLVFNIPKIFIDSIQSIKNIKAVFFFDELENSTLEIQTYLQTLIREKKDPCSIKISGRLYSIKTHKTYCANEENVEGSEFEQIELDSILRENKFFMDFAMRLCAKRLTLNGIDSTIDSLKNNFEVDIFSFKKTNNNFDELNKSLNFVFSDSEMRKYFKKLKNALINYQKEGCQDIINNLQCPKNPILEKANIYLFYRKWALNKDLLNSSKEVKLECEKYLRNKKSELSNIIPYYKHDFYSQILYDYNKKQRYLGIDRFIEMSGGLPRNFLLILKHTFSNAIFLGENPFVQNKISIKAQQKGVEKVSKWFFYDVNIKGRDQIIVKKSIKRLARLFRELRFSDKPTECSCISFSVDSLRITDECKRVMELSRQWSLLIDNIKGRKDKNSKRVDLNYKLNPMLCPHWDLPIYSRGTIPLKPDLVNSIFDINYENEFENMLKDRIIYPMNIPFKVEKRHKNSDEPVQMELFDD